MSMDSAATLGSQPTSQAMILKEVNEGIATLTLNKPNSRNSLSEAMIMEMIALLEGIDADGSIQVVILASTGPAFCAGHDLKELNAHRSDPDGGREFFAKIMMTCSVMMQAIVRLRVPVIAAVQGVATAAGCQLVASCDLAVAGSTAKFATPGVSIGLFCSTPMVALSRNVSRKHAMEMLLTGEMIAAEKAMQIGLVNRVVAPGAELTESLALAQQIVAKSPQAVKIGKEAFYRQLEMPLAEAYDYAAEVMVENMMVGDAKEGICAFLEKRPPQWQDE